MDAKQESTNPSAQDQDAIDLLIADHRRVARLFAQFGALKEGGDDDAKASIVARICQELTVHTAIEEEIFYPAVRKAIEDDDLLDEAYVEHAGAKALIAQLLGADPNDDYYDAKVTVLGEQIDHHVEEEEGSMFPQVKASGIDTVALAAALLQRKTEILADPNAPPRPTGVEDDAAGAGRGEGFGDPPPLKSKKRTLSPQKRTRRTTVAKARSTPKKKSGKAR